MTYEKLRDAAADAYVKEQDEIGEFNLRHVDQPDQSFQAGAEWATAHWLEQVRVLTEALEPFKRIAESREFSDPNNVWEFRIGGDKWRALKEALTKWAELSKPSEG